LYNTTNIDASTAYDAQYMRVGSVVTVSGRVAVDPTALAATLLGISLPIASNFTLTGQLGGVAFDPDIVSLGAALLGDTTNDRASMSWVTSDTGNRFYYYIYQYVTDTV